MQAFCDGLPYFITAEYLTLMAGCMSMPMNAYDIY